MTEAQGEDSPVTMEIQGKEGHLKTTEGVMIPRGAGTAETEGGMTKWQCPHSPILKLSTQ